VFSTYTHSDERQPVRVRGSATIPAAPTTRRRATPKASGTWLPSLAVGHSLSS